MPKSGRSIITLLEASAKIRNARSFREELVRLTGAHACLVRISHGSNEPALQGDICSYVEGDVVREHMLALRKKRNFTFTDRLTKDEYPPPSRLWKVMSTTYPSDAQKLRALIIGSCEALKELAPLAVLVPWGERQESVKPSLTEKPIHFNLRRDEITTDTKMDFRGQTDINSLIHTGISSELLNVVARVSDYHILGDFPTSLVSIPVALRTKPDGLPIDFISIDLMWFGTPIQADVKSLLYAIIFCSGLAPRISFERDIDDVYSYMVDLAHGVKARNSGVHDVQSWLQNGQRYLLSNGGYLFGRGIPKAVISAPFHCGIEGVYNVSEGKINLEGDAKGIFDLNALFVLASGHLLHVGKNNIQVDHSTNQAIEIRSLKQIDYRAWSSFLWRFDNGRKLYNDGAELESVSLVGKTLTLEYSGEDHAQRLAQKILMLYHSQVARFEINRHEVAWVFVNALLCPDHHIEQVSFDIRNKNPSDKQTIIIVRNSDLEYLSIRFVGKLIILEVL